MKKIFDGQCKDCEFGLLREDQKPNYIACQLGGIREPEQTCNLILPPVEDPECSQGEPDYKAMWEEAIDMLTYVYHTPTKKTDWTIVEELFAKHISQIGVKKEEKL